MLLSKVSYQSWIEQKHQFERTGQLVYFIFLYHIHKTCCITLEKINVSLLTGNQAEHNDFYAV